MIFQTFQLLAIENTYRGAFTRRGKAWEMVENYIDFLFMGANLGNFQLQGSFLKSWDQPTNWESSYGICICLGLTLKRPTRDYSKCFTMILKVFTEAFNLNLLHRIIGEARGDFDDDALFIGPTYGSKLVSNVEATLVSKKEKPDCEHKATGAGYHFEALSQFHGK